MLHSVPLQPSSKQHFVLRRRFELTGALVVVAFLPWIIAPHLFSTPNTLRAFDNSLFANIMAVIVALWIRMSVGTFPGIRSGQTIGPAILAGHAVAIGMLLMFRLPYHRPSLIEGVLFHTIWSYGLYLFVVRRQKSRIAIVPFGEIENLRSIDNVEWWTLEAPDLKRTDGCHAIVADFTQDLPAEWEAFLADAALAGRIVYQVEQLKESLTGRVQVRHLSENSFGSLVPARAYSAVKHTGDFAAALLILPLVLPILAACAIAIRICDGGPVLFRQQRTGLAGKQFSVFKFRTMKVRESDGSREDAMTHADDIRITRVGKFLRQSRLDELPQLFNILRGEMSFIGPRPEAEVLSFWYTGDIPFYRYRHVVKPGITGWAQVNQGHVVTVEEINEKLQYDFFYIKYFSPWLDLLIIFRTLKVMLTGFGSR